MRKTAILLLVMIGALVMLIDHTRQGPVEDVPQLVNAERAW
jgi:hypothetical protein